MMQLFFLTPKTSIHRDGLNHAGTSVQISSLSHLALAGGQLFDQFSSIELIGKPVFVPDSI
jgi:hypothetical protein